MKVLKLTFIFLIVQWTHLLAQNASDSVAFLTARWDTNRIEKGILHLHYHFKEKQLFNANQNIHILKFKNKPRKIQLAFASAGDSLVLTSELAKQNNALAAINGTFFDVKKGGSVDFIKIDNKILDTTQHNGKKLAGHQQSAILIKKNKISIQKARDSIDFQWTNALKSFPDAMVTGPLLIWKGQEYPLSKSAFDTNRHPRSCACVTQKNEVILMTVDGRTAESYGVSLYELRYLLKLLDCKNAINFDGGGSTTMWINQEGVVNMPCDNKKFDHEGERKVSNIVILKKE
jgi:exopolysaccharide biosynthesis protein